jgi:SAM-dependent methyltransferase
MPDDFDARHALVERAMADSKAFKVQQLVAEWNAKAHGLACQDAFDEIRADIEPALLALDEGPTTLEYNPDLVAPAYWTKVWFHRTAGGWDACDYNGFVHGELVHKRLVAKSFPGDIFAQRRLAAEQAPKATYRRILDCGASSGHYTQALSQVYPDAEVWGVDLSPRMLEHARRVGNAKGYAWKLFVRAAEDTGFEAESFDLVTSYIILHEMPPRAIKAWLVEALRLLEPGGDLVASDVSRYADLDKMTSWRADWAAKFGGEPYWRASASLDLKALAEEVGFVDVEAYAAGPRQYPYILRGRKPG